MSERFTIRRAAHGETERFFLNARATAQDTEITYEALGMLTYLLSKPNDWKVQPGDLRKRVGNRNSGKPIGRDQVYAILKELITARYIERVSVKNDKGRVSSVEYVVHERPLPENPDTENPDTENTHITEYREEQDTESTSAANAAAIEQAPIEEPQKPARKVNPMYDVVKEVWGYTAALNGKYQKFLTGQPKHTWSEYNITPAMTPDEIREWAKWYRKVELHDDPEMNMLESPAKIQSSVAKWREQRTAGAVTFERQATMKRINAMPVFTLTPPKSEAMEEAS